MRVTGLAIGLLDVTPEREEDLHVWYEADHLPENLALEDVTGAARYAATNDCLEFAGPREPEIFRRTRPRFLTIYQLAADDLAGAAERWRQLGLSLVKQGRGFPMAFSHAEVFRLEAVLCRQGVVVREAAVPHLPHRGVLVTLTRIPYPARLDEIDSWWREVHGPDVLQVPGFLAGLRLHSIATGAADAAGARALNLYLLDGDPVGAIRAMGQRIPEWKERGRLTSSAGTAPVVWNCPYRLWRPPA